MFLRTPLAWAPSITHEPLDLFRCNHVVTPDLCCDNHTTQDVLTDGALFDAQSHRRLFGAEHVLPLCGPLEGACQFSIANTVGIGCQPKWSFDVFVNKELTADAHVLDFYNRLSASWANVLSHVRVSLAMTLSVYHVYSSVKRSVSGGAVVTPGRTERSVMTSSGEGGLNRPEPSQGLYSESESQGQNYANS